MLPLTSGFGRMKILRGFFRFAEMHLSPAD